MTLALALLSLLPQATHSATSWPGVAELPTLIAEHELGEPLDQLREYLRERVDRRAGEHLLSAVRESIVDPLGTPAFAIGLTDRLDRAARAEHTGVESIVADARGLLDLPPGAPSEMDPALFGAETWAERLAAARAALEAAADHVELALAKVPVAEREELCDDLRALLDDFVEHIYVHQKPHDVATWRTVEQVDLGELLAAASALAPLCDPRFYLPLRNQLRRGEKPPRARLEGVSGNLLLVEQTAVGPIIVGGMGRNHYDVPVALLIDVGGNDTYTARATRSGDGHPVNVVIDVAGRDRYEADGSFAQGCGLLGVSMLVDHIGNDEYVAGRAAQGAAVLGVGILLDRSGKDSYAGDAFVQGAGCFGLGCLIDLDGDDVSTASIDSQGFGWPISVGLLIDLDGDDERSATGKYTSSYGTEGQFQGNSQGASFGFRTLAAGGFGILVDGGGDDRSTVGEFGHGCGYYLGCGIVRDRGGDDVVQACRYGIATGAHMGAGVVLDDAGDDEWHNPITASIAGNWDLTCCFFLDAAGNDRYVSAGITVGSSTISSLACFIDGDGEDRYEVSGSQSYGNAGHTEDVARRTRCVGVFLDLGGDDDVYSKVGLDPEPDDGVVCVRHKRDRQGEREAESGVGLFVDR